MLITAVQRALHGKEYGWRKKVHDHLLRVARRHDSRDFRLSGQPAGTGLRRLNTLSLSELDNLELREREFITLLVRL